MVKRRQPPSPAGQSSREAVSNRPEDQAELASLSPPSPLSPSRLSNPPIRGGDTEIDYDSDETEAEDHADEDVERGVGDEGNQQKPHRIVGLSNKPVLEQAEAVARYGAIVRNHHLWTTFENFPHDMSHDPATKRQRLDGAVFVYPYAGDPFQVSPENISALPPSMPAPPRPGDKDRFRWAPTAVPGPSPYETLPLPGRPSAPAPPPTLEGARGLSTASLPPAPRSPSFQGTIGPWPPAQLMSVTRPISPPPLRRQQPPQPLPLSPRAIPPPAPLPRVTKSPFQLTRIRDLPESENLDTVALDDLLGDPSIEECWQFNFLFDIPFIMSKFPEQTRNKVKVHVVHGFYKQDDPRKVVYEDEASQYDNVALHVAPMPQPFGTHHSKLMILFRHNTAQIIIHTANMIAKDWTNLTNAVWRSPFLPKLSAAQASEEPEDVANRDDLPMGSPERFKWDFLNYLRAYNNRQATTTGLIERLRGHCFRAVRAVLIASVPGGHLPHQANVSAWGHPALRRALKIVPCQAGRSEIVVQVSSIATLGPRDTWLTEHFGKAIRSCMPPAGPRTTINALLKQPALKIVFPTPDEIRMSLNGYASGASIHTKIQTIPQEKQLKYLHPLLCHWANDAHNGKQLPAGSALRDGGRKRAAPHVKTYVRYALDTDTIDWILLTSANLSKQAWGAEAMGTGEVKIASWEIGVLLWPALVANQPDAIMVPTFKTDVPNIEATKGLSANAPVVGVRIPYNLPLQQYGKDEVPWVASMIHREPDCMGETWTLGNVLR